MSAGWRVVVSGPAARGVGRLPEKAASAVAELLGGALAEAPKQVGKPLRFELEGLWVARRGPYRVVYEIDERKRLVTVLDVDHRSRIYRGRQRAR